MFRIDIIPGEHILTGIDYYNKGESDGVCFILDGKHYYGLHDPDDGYRSWMNIGFSRHNKICKRRIPEQKVFVDIFDVGPEEIEQWRDGADYYLQIRNIDDNSIILELKEEHYDAYYPCASWSYHPENLPINKNKK